MNASVFNGAALHRNWLHSWNSCTVSALSDKRHYILLKAGLQILLALSVLGAAISKSTKTLE